MAAHAGLKVSQLAQLMLIVLVLGAGTDYGLAAAVTAYTPGGFGGTISAPAGTDSDAGTRLLSKHFPASAANPTNFIFRLSQPVWDNPDPINAATSQLNASGLFTGVTGPLNPAIQFETGLKAGDPSTTAAMNAVPSLRTEAAAVAKTLGARQYGVGGEAPAGHWEPPAPW